MMTARDVRIPTSNKTITKKYRDEVSLYGTELLVHVRTVTICKLLGDEAIEQKVSRYEYPLKEIAERDIAKLRMSGKPVFLLKINGRYYRAFISKRLHLLAHDLIGDHMCKYCDKAIATSDECGGCQKVRDRDFNECLSADVTKRKAMQDSKRIEKYPFIKAGYESFGVNQETFMVAECDNYKSYSPRKLMSPEDKRNLLISLEEWYKG